MRVRGRVRSSGSILVAFGASDSPAELILWLCAGRVIGGWRNGCFVSYTVQRSRICDRCHRAHSSHVQCPFALAFVLSMPPRFGLCPRCIYRLCHTWAPILHRHRLIPQIKLFLKTAEGHRSWISHFEFNNSTGCAFCQSSLSPTS